MPLLKAKVSRALQKQKDVPEHQVKLEEHEQATINNLYSAKTFIKEECSTPVTNESAPSLNEGLKVRVKQEQTTSAAPKRQPSKKEPQSNKNIVKNYARAMINFGLAPMAMSHLTKILQKEGVDIQSFRRFIKGQKEDINSIKKLRELLLITDDDKEKAAALKRSFRQISEVFIKFFSANWIFNSKISDKSLHLRYRFKILRRIRNPEHFTYLENFNKTK